MESVPESRSIIPAVVPASSTSNWVDEDLIQEILRRLPVKSLMRFRSVCKYWKSLISSSSFITLHSSSASSTTPANIKPYLRRRRAGYDDPYGDYALCLPQEEYIRRQVRFPFRFRYAGSMYVHKFDFVDLIKGLICLSYSLDCSHHHLILWNPAIHKYLPIPPQTFDAPNILDLDLECTAHFYHHALGFGYDTSKNDFKVVRIWIPNYPCDCECKSLLPVCDVYSTSTCVWRVSIVESIKIYQIYNETGCFVNGTVHWLVADYDFTKRFVLMFDCEREEFTTMELPQESDDFHIDEYSTTELLEYGGMLSLLANDGDGLVEMWVMEENANSWKQLYQILGDIKLNWNTDIPQSSYEKLAPYGPDECIKFRLNAELSDDILCNNVYEESMLLMNDTESLSYTKTEIVQIDNSDPYESFQSSDSYYDSYYD